MAHRKKNRQSRPSQSGGGGRRASRSRASDPGRTGRVDSGPATVPLPQEVHAFMKSLPAEVRTKVTPERIEILWREFNKRGRGVFSDTRAQLLAEDLGPHAVGLRDLVEQFADSMDRSRTSGAHPDAGAEPAAGKKKPKKSKEPKILKILPGVQVNLDQARRGLDQYFGVRLGGSQREEEPEEELTTGSMLADLSFASTVKGDHVEYRATSNGAEFVMVYPAVLPIDALIDPHKVMIIDEGKTEQRTGADGTETEVTVYAVILADTTAQVNDFKTRIDQAKDAASAEPIYKKGQKVKLEVDLPVSGNQREFITTAPDGRVVVIRNPLMFQYAAGRISIDIDDENSGMEVRITRGAQKNVDTHYEAEIVVEKSIAIVWAQIRNTLLEYKDKYRALTNADVKAKAREAIASDDIKHLFDRELTHVEGLHALLEGVLYGVERLMTRLQVPIDPTAPRDRLTPAQIVEQVTILKKQADDAQQLYAEQIRKMYAYVEGQVDTTSGPAQVVAASIAGFRDTVDQRFSTELLEDWVDQQFTLEEDERLASLIASGAVAEPLDRRRELQKIYEQIEAVTDEAERRKLLKKAQDFERYYLALAYEAAAVGSYDAAKEARGGDDYERFCSIMSTAGFAVGLDPAIRVQGDEYNSHGTDTNLSLKKGDRLSNVRVEDNHSGLMVYFDIDGDSHDNALDKFQQLLESGSVTAEEVHDALDDVYDSGIQHCTVDEFLVLLRGGMLKVEYASVRQERLYDRLKGASMIEFIHLLNAYREEIDLSGRRDFIPYEEGQFIEQVNELTTQRLRIHLQLPDRAQISMSTLVSRDTGILPIDIIVPDIFEQRAFTVTGRETLAETTALARRVAAALEAHEHKKVEGGVGLREGLKGTVADVSKLNAILHGVTFGPEQKKFSVVPNLLNADTYALLIGGQQHGIDAEVFARLQTEGALVVTEGPIQYPEGAQASIERCSERFVFQPPLRLGEVFVFDYAGEGIVHKSEGIVPGMRLVLRGYEPGDGTAKGGRLTFYYEGAVDARGEVNQEFAIPETRVKVGAIYEKSVQAILNALKAPWPKGRLVRIQTPEGIHGELSAAKPRHVESRDLMAVLDLPHEDIEGRSVMRFQWNGTRGKSGDRVILGPGDVCRVLRWNDAAQQVQVAIEASSGELVNTISIPYRLLEAHASSIQPAPTTVASEGERNRLFYRLHDLEMQGVIATKIDESLLEFLNEARAGTAPFIHVRREQVIEVPVQGPKGKAKGGQAITEQKTVKVMKTLIFYEWNDTGVAFRFSDERIRRAYSLPDFFAALEDPANMLGSTSELSNAYTDLPKQDPTLEVTSAPDVSTPSIDADALLAPDADTLDAINAGARSGTPVAEFLRNDFLRDIARLGVRPDQLFSTGSMKYYGKPVEIDFVHDTERKSAKGELVMFNQDTGKQIFPKTRGFMRRKEFTYEEVYRLIEQGALALRPEKTQEVDPDQQSEEDEKDDQFVAYLKLEHDITPDLLHRGLYYRGTPIEVAFLDTDQRKRYGELALVDLGEVDKGGGHDDIRIPHKRFPFLNTDRVTYADFIRLLDNGDITVGPPTQSEKREISSAAPVAEQPHSFDELFSSGDHPATAEEESKEQFLARKRQFLDKLRREFGISEKDLLDNIVFSKDGVEKPVELLIANADFPDRIHDVYFDPEIELDHRVHEGASFDDVLFYLNFGDIRKKWLI